MFGVQATETHSVTVPHKLTSFQMTEISPKWLKYLAKLKEELWEQYELDHSVWVLVIPRLLQIYFDCFFSTKPRTKGSKADWLPGNFNFWPWLWGKRKHHRWRDPLSEMVGHKSKLHSCRRSQLLSESKCWNCGLVLYKLSRERMGFLPNSILPPIEGSRLLLGQW